MFYCLGDGKLEHWNYEGWWSSRNLEGKKLTRSTIGFEQTEHFSNVCCRPHHNKLPALYSTQHQTSTHAHTFNGPLSGTTRVSWYQKGKTNLNFTEARDSEWQWHQLEHMQVCTSLQTDNHSRTTPLSFLQAGCPSCRPTNSVKALKAWRNQISNVIIN